MMPLRPEDIQGHRFRAAFRGYAIEEVNSFLARVARDFQLLLDSVSQATASAKDDPVLNSALGDFLARAQESAHSLLASARRDTDKRKEEARAEARQIREQAAQEAAALKEKAQERAAELLEAANALVASAQQETEASRAGQHDEVDEIRSDALQESEAIVAAARDKAGSLLEVAELYARDLITRAQRDFEERVQPIARRRAEMEAFEQTLLARASALQKSLEEYSDDDSRHQYVELSTAGDALEEGLEIAAVNQELEQRETA
jgi:DivIVA domain-containing protein